MGSERRLWINGSFPDNTFVDLDGFDSLDSVDDFTQYDDAPGTLPQNTWEVKYPVSYTHLTLPTTEAV